MTRPPIMVVDESISHHTAPQLYIIGSAIMINPAARSDLDNAITEALRVGSQSRRRPFHWVTEGPRVRFAMIDVLNQLNATALAVTRPVQNPRALEQARLNCLEALFSAARPFEAELILFESREKSKRNVGQNRIDHRAITAARHSQQVIATAKYEWVDKTEPLCWLADAVAGAVNHSHRGDTTYLDAINNLQLDT